MEVECEGDFNASGFKCHDRKLTCDFNLNVIMMVTMITMTVRVQRVCERPVELFCVKRKCFVNIDAGELWIIIDLS